MAATSEMTVSATQDIAGIFREQEPRQKVGAIRFTDKKLRQKIREKKIAMGHKPDDHEEQTVTM